MVDDKTKRLSVYLPERMKLRLGKMADETGLSMTQLIVMATHGLLSNYECRGGDIFSNLVVNNSPTIDQYVAEKVTSLHHEKNSMQEYYGARANEFEEIYHRADVAYQKELKFLSQTLQEKVADRVVLEVACGTGYWTKIAAETAQFILGLDIRAEVVQLAKEKNLPRDKVQFIVGDAYKLDQLERCFDFGLANFWFSHIPRNKLDQFLSGFHQHIGVGSQVFMADNVFVPGRGGKLVTKENNEDTYKIRKLADGSTHEIIKNYYSYEELYEIFKPMAKDLDIFIGHSFWYVSYTIA